MNQIQSTRLMFGFCLFFFHVKAQTVVQPNTDSALHPLHPSLVLFMGILAVACSLTFLVIAYARFCHTAPLGTQNQNIQGLIRSRSRFSGIERTVIESIPFFRFSSLKGSKQGLECAVCISRFEDSEVLRLLPKCRHAFHMNCIDQWLASHSTCPLCRYKFDVKDLKSFTFSNSLRYSHLYNPSNLAEDPNIELFVHREQDHQGSSRFNINSFRSQGKGKREESLIEADGDQRLLHKFKHKIMVSDVLIKNRWSDVDSSDLLFLNSEMLNIMSSNRFSSSGSKEIRLLHNGFSIEDNMDKIKEDIERKRLYESKLSRINRSRTISTSNLASTSFADTNSFKLFDPVQKRSQSEITNLSRFKQFSVNRSTTESSNNGKEERTRRLWLLIARRTVQWFARRERSSEQSDCRKQPSNV